MLMLFSMKTVLVYPYCGKHPYPIDSSISHR